MYAKKEQEAHSEEIVLRLPDLDHAKSAVLSSLNSPNSRRNYKFTSRQGEPAENLVFQELRRENMLAAEQILQIVLPKARFSAACVQFCSD